MKAPIFLITPVKVTSESSEIVVTTNNTISELSLRFRLYNFQNQHRLALTFYRVNEKNRAFKKTIGNKHKFNTFASMEDLM